MGLVQGKGHMVHLTGQVAWDANENIVGKDDVSAQTTQCFKNIEALLNEVGGTLEDLVSLTTYFLRPDDLLRIQAVRNTFLPKENPPVSTSVRVAGLGHDEFLVELTPIAVIPHTRFKGP